MRVKMSRRTSAFSNYLLACVAVSHTPISVATAILNATTRNEYGGCGLNALLTYV
jgi:hypothetical protein